jgi:hypothetical protein
MVCHDRTPKQGHLFPPPEALGVVCRCGQATFTTAWRTFQDGTRHIEMRCAACNRFQKWLPQHKVDPDQGEPAVPAFAHQPRPASAHAQELKPPEAPTGWLGHVRLADDLWRPVCWAQTLHKCWDALLTYPARCDLLAIPCDPPHQGQEPGQ